MLQLKGSGQVAEDFLRPNVLCFSTAEKLLYIVDTGQPANNPHPIKAFDVVDGVRLMNDLVVPTK